MVREEEEEWFAEVESVATYWSHCFDPSDSFHFLLRSGMISVRLLRVMLLFLEGGTTPPWSSRRFSPASLRVHR